MVKHYDNEGHQVISTQDARGAEIVMKTVKTKVIFFGLLLSLLIVPPVLVWSYFGFP